MKTNKHPVTLLFLYTRLPDYFLQCIFELMKTLPVNSKAWIVHYETDKNSPYAHVTHPNISFIKRNELKLSIVGEIKPHIIYTVGWSDKTYNAIAKRAKGSIPVIMGLDNPWRGNPKQRVACLLSPFYFKKRFDYIWVAGVSQYEYARRLWFSPAKIIRGLYCANIAPILDLTDQVKESKQIIFAGRLVNYKRPDWLLKAYSELLMEEPALREWRLLMVGNGPMQADLKSKYGSQSEIEFENFIQPSDMYRKLAKASIFCLPSVNEHWGVAIQEAAAAGLALLISDSCEAGTEFLHSHFNGYEFCTGSFLDFKDKLRNLLVKDSEELIEMGNRSRYLAKRIQHTDWCAAFNSVLYNENK